MTYKIFLLIFTIFCCFHATNSKNTSVCKLQSQESVKLDTINLVQGKTFDSNLASIVNKCILLNTETKTLTKSNVVSTQKALNKELKTEMFNTVVTVIGKNMKFENSNGWVKVMEWHFDCSETVVRITNLLAKLNDGTITHTIFPNRCIWNAIDKKIYIVNFTPSTKDQYWVDDFQSCLN